MARFVGMYSSFHTFIYTYYYRTSKIGISLLLIIILGDMYKVIKGKNYLQSGSLKPYQLFIIFLLATLGRMLFDVLGGFFATFIIIYMLIAYLYKPDKNKAAALGGMTMGYMIWVLYFLYLGPFLMYSITGQQANRSYLYGAPFQYFFGFLLLGIPLLILDVVRLMFGYITETGGAVLSLNLVAVSIWLVRGSRRKTSKYVNFDAIQDNSKAYWKKFLAHMRMIIGLYEPLLSIVFLLAGLAIIYTLLVTRHPPVLWPDVRPSYYFMRDPRGRWRPDRLGHPPLPTWSRSSARTRLPAWSR